MATATEKFSVELPIDVINSISELARGKKMSISKFISSLIKKESKTVEEKRWGKISIALKEEQEDAAASGFTEQDLSKLIKEIRQQQKNENCY